MVCKFISSKTTEKFIEIVKGFDEKNGNFYWLEVQMMMIIIKKSCH